MVSEILSVHDRKIISDIVSHYPSGDRVKVMRSIFKHDITFEHFIYIGVLIGNEAFEKGVRKQDGEVDRMKTLMYLN